MTQEKKLSVFTEVKNNYIISYKLLLENWKPFIKTELFTLVSIAIIVLILNILNTLLGFNFLVVQKVSSRNSFSIQIQLSGYFSLLVILNLLMLTFLTSQFGLAHDIFHSGHMYAEFSSSFTYYRRHKFSYALLTLIIYWSQFLADPLSNLPLIALFQKSNVFPVALSDSLSSINFYSSTYLIDTFLRQLLLDFVQIFSIILIVEILVSLTKTNSLKLAFKENFDILNRNKLIISVTWFTFFVIFILPESLIGILILIFLNYFFSNATLVELGFLHLLVNLLFLFISMPIMSLLATRLYISLMNSKSKEPG